jgi:hypothetical protein
MGGFGIATRVVGPPLQHHPRFDHLRHLLVSSAMSLPKSAGFNGSAPLPFNIDAKSLSGIHQAISQREPTSSAR